MQFISRKMDSKSPDGQLILSLNPIVQGLGMSLIELNIFRTRGKSVQVKAVVYKNGTMGLEDCSRVHRSIMPRLELAFGGHDIFLEVSSTGIDRLVKDGMEFAHYIGRNVRCYRTDISDWTAGKLIAVDEEKVILLNEDGEIVLNYEIIAKARLNASPPLAQED